MIELDATGKRTSALSVPAALRRALAGASSVVFPSDRAKRIDGSDHVLVVINRSSTSRPTGYCGAGEEGTLYVLALRGTRAVQRFSLPVQGCLDSVSLETESGTRSPCRAITWRDAPADIDIRWEYVAHDGATHRVYRFLNGTFVEVESSR